MSSYQLPTEYDDTVVVKDSSAIRASINQNVRSELNNIDSLNHYNEKKYTLKEVEQFKKDSYQDGLINGIEKGREEVSSELSDLSSNLDKEISLYKAKIEQLKVLSDLFNDYLKSIKIDDELRFADIICSIVFEFIENKIEDKALLSSITKKYISNFNRENNVYIETALNTKNEIEDTLEELGFNNIRVREVESLIKGSLKITVDDKVNEINLSAYLKDFVELLESKVAS